MNLKGPRALKSKTFDIERRDILERWVEILLKN